MSHEVQVQKLTDIMAQFVGFTAKKLPDDVIAKLEELRAQEDSPMATVIYDTMFRNQELAIKLDRPSCQDTGVLQFWVKCGTKFPLIDDLEVLLKEAVVKATLMSTIPEKMSEREPLLYGGTSYRIPINVRSILIWQAAAVHCPAMRLCSCRVKAMKE